MLAGSSLFGGLDRPAMTEILAAARERWVAGGDALFREGEPAERFCVVVEGRLKLTQVGLDGHEVILRFVGPGEAAAVLAIFEGTDYPLTAWAVGPASVLEWQREALQALLQRHPALAVNTVRLLSERLREVQERFRELATERVAQRIARALLRLVRQAGRKVKGGVLIDMSLSRQNLAELTGTTLFTVSRVLSEWESQGILESARERVTITNPHALVAIAEDLPGASGEEKGKGKR
ncbi:MAG: Crp/Fnr family transcriptional regulator [Acidobacteriia bacterium]|nr:Crp/Fnr family transcriptional regulator [Terriglobia bacterium]